jgi:hypothetical protein
VVLLGYGKLASGLAKQTGEIGLVLIPILQEALDVETPWQVTGSGPGRLPGLGSHDKVPIQGSKGLLIQMKLCRVAVLLHYHFVYFVV